MIDALEYIEKLFVFPHDGGFLFEGTPDRMLVFPDTSRIVVDFKLGRLSVQPAESNLQLRAYLTMQPASDYYVPSGTSEFRPSSLLRRKNCPGSLAMELRIPAPPNDDRGTKYAEEGSLLHAHLADRMKSRSELEPEQIETIERAEAMEAEFLEIVKQQMKPGWGFGAILQPRISSKPFIVAYSPQDLVASRREIIALWKAAHEPDAPRRASEDACRHCRATAICPEHNAWVMAVEKIAHLPAYSWTPAQWHLFLERKSALSKFIDERYEEAKAIKAANPDAIPGWELRDGHERRVVTDVVQAWAKLEDKITAREFSECCELSLGALEKTIWETAPVRLSQKAVKQLVSEILEGIVEKKRNKPSLVKTD